ncbi:hypothetical protein F4824DRAFT_464667 [Ustulina deusta]|nr:hypothetical protein F4824DRAFT_464667 [Ustulina deusta]
MNRLAHPYRPKGAKPEIYLRECEPLRGYMTAKSKRLSMASRIKCFEQTHYNFSQGKAPLTRVLLPFATDFRLYDSISNVWVADLAKPLTLEHLCGIQIPRSLRDMFPKRAHPPTIVDGPSSYEIQANQTLAPKDTPVQAFSACQKILAGKRRRWPNLLVELSSSNLNLSDEDVMRVICQLASQAGPGIPDEPLRAVHEVFKYPVFTRRLERILQRLLESIQTNWREHNIMQLVITLALRLHCLAGQSLGNETLMTARKCLVEWISELRRKIQATKDRSEAQRYATYGLYAALLCRRTFAAFLGSRNHLSRDDLSTWMQASIAIQENMLHDLSRLPDAIRDLLFRDAKMVYHLQNNIRDAMETYRSIVGIEILKYWSGHFMHTEQTFAPWGFLPEPHGRWIVATTPGRFMERLHFNYIEGHLLVNGRPRSKLPLSIANDDAVMSIFGVQHLITYPSNQPGMSHRLAHANRGLQIHFGLRDKRAVIRAIKCTGSSNSEETWEFVPQSKLGIPGNFDLPTELIQNCGHWLNINTRCLEIRRGSLLKTTYYNKRESDWFIDIPRRRAYRGEGGSQLVDPHSEIFAQIASIFADFEQADRLTVFQPQNLASRLTVELKHFDLHFVVNQNRLLYCQQLNAEIDIDQDAGTWYGLRSKIVMREVNTRSRSIIVPLGKLIAHPNGFHVDVRIREAAHYARFTIDDIIGRLSCSPEPRLIYTKALYHATTSFCLPDTLTGRTGSSEAFSILRSGTSQPWIPVIKAVNEILEEFSKLAPRREYHPPNIRRIQRVSWDPNLTPSIQCDGYLQLIEAIREKSNNLEAFTTGSEFELKEIGHLSCRGRSQREIYDPLLDADTSQGFDEAVYSPRDRISGMEAAQVYQIACVILSNCSQFHMSRSLSTILESSDIIGGFSNPDTQTATSYSGPLINQIEDSVIEKWGELIDFCRHKADRASLLFRLGLLAFHSKADMDVIHSLAAFCLVDKIRNLVPPQYQHFADFKSHERPSVSLLEGLIGSTYPKFKPEISKQGQALWFDAESRNATQFEEACKKEGFRLAKHIHQYWPTPATDITTEMLNSAVRGPQNGQPYFLVDVSSALDNVRPEWERRYANLELSNYIRRVDDVLVSLCRVHDIATPTSWVTREPDFVEARKTVSYRSIVRNWSAKRGPILEVVKSSLVGILEEYQESAARQQPMPDALPELDKLEKIVQSFGHSTNNLRKQYGRDLSQSLAALKMRTQQIERDGLAVVPQFGVVKEALRRAHAHVEDVWAAIATAATAGDNRACWLELGAMKPLSTAVDLLKLLRSTESIAFGLGMKEAIVSYGIALTDVQHLTRIQRALLERNRQALHNELRQLGHKTWRPIEIPDWLLLEIDSNIIIRDEQVNVAKAMIDPTLGNGVLQLSMGKGKTSCIIPMVAAVLADGQSLSRVVVPKALIMQTAQTMQSRLGGLVGRQVIHFPFSRKTPTRKQILDLYAELHQRTRRSHGIVLTCAEHLLSYKLSGWQQFIDSKKSAAEQMIRFQEWLNTHCRDVLDECDFTLSVKTQLNYPSGSEMSVDFHPYRWEIVQDLLGLIDCHLRDLQYQQPNGILVTSIRENFPAVQFLRAATEAALHDRIVEDVCSGRVTLLRPASSQYQQKERAIREVLCGTKISEKLLSRVANLFENPEIAHNALLLVRGLLMHKIIIVCLNKRWNVQYGLHPDRDPIAVPFEAKGKPSEQAEYGHPDVAILFTCLSFYYAGLTQAQLVQVVGHLLQSSDPAAQYECLTSTCPKLPASLRRWTVLNTDDKAQMEQLWSCLRWNRTTINHFLNRFVFPVHARQFEIKLQACSWDIPVCSENKTQLTRTTGFSGTNDNRWMLPLTISQRDLPELQHTSAEVLSYLLQRRNREFHMIPNPRKGKSKEFCFLEDLKAKGVSVLIDVGAYISEMDNQELAHTWLLVDSKAKAVVYFRNDNRAWVHYRNNTKEDVPLLATPLAEDLSECNVFLDEGHTRGVDLRLPTNACGAVTLALKLTKDHAVQAAMRLRQLQTTQKVCFYGPRAVVSSIRDFHQLRPYEKIESIHVVSWLLEQTCRSIEDQQGLYAAQGIDFCQRTDTMWQCKKFMTNLSERQKLLRVLKQPERKTLQELYGSALKKPATSLESSVTSPQLRSFIERLALTSKSGQGGFQAGAFEEVEQEREVEAQVEQVRQVEKRIQYEALSFPGMHPDVVQFAQTGKLEASSTSKAKQPGFEHAFSFVGRTAIAKSFGVHESNAKLFVSKEFTKTIQITKDSHEGDNFLRPVEWIVWSPQTETALVIIPEEAEHLLAYLRSRRGKSRVHLITYAAAVTKAMMEFNHLDFYTYPELPTGFHIPKQIKVELGILAGRLYVDEHEWKTVAEYMMGAADDSNKIAANPAAFVLEWLTVRRKTVNVLRTPMGYICTGREMESTDSPEDANGDANEADEAELVE